jgi:hypothetical protein
MFSAEFSKPVCSILFLSPTWELMVIGRFGSERRGCESHINIPTGVAWKIYRIKLFKYIIKPTRTRVLIPKFMKIVYKTWVDEK